MLYVCALLLIYLSNCFCSFTCFGFVSLVEIEEEYQTVLSQKAIKWNELLIKDVELGTLLGEAKELNSKLLRMTEVEGAKLVVESGAKLEIVVLENQLAIISSLLCEA